MTRVCKEIDDWLENYYENKIKWIVELSNGEHVYQDDGRNLNEESAWIRLGKYVKENGLTVVAMDLNFRSYWKRLPRDADGYFFVNSVMGQFGSQHTIVYCIAGHLEDGVIHVSKYEMPVLDPIETDTRDCETAGPCLIKNI